MLWRRSSAAYVGELSYAKSQERKQLIITFLSNGTYQMVRQRLPEDIPKPSQRDGRTDISGGDSGLGPAIWKNAGDAPPVIRPPPVRVPAQLRGQSNRSQQGTITAK